MNEKRKKRICWVTATYFLDVDLPIVPFLKEHFEIDWIIVSNRKQSKSDREYISSQSNCTFTIIEDEGYFFSPSHFRVMLKLVKMLTRNDYDLYYFDISDLVYLFPMVKHRLDIHKVILATHNVSVPKGARLAMFARISMNYILSNFKNFQVFSLSQRDYLLSKCPKANVFYCPLMLKDYGPMGVRKFDKMKRFLFFGNIVRYKRLDILLEAVNRLAEKGETRFMVNIHGYARPEVWEKDYASLIKYPQFVNTDIRRVPNEEVAQLFSDNDFFVMPYQDIAQSGAMTVAFNYNMPIIASDLPAFNEFIEDGYNSFILPNCDSDSLADMMVRAIEMSQAEYEKVCGKLKCTVAQKLSREKIIGKYVEFLNGMMEDA